MELLFVNLSIENITYELLTQSVITDDIIMKNDNIIYPFKNVYNIYYLNDTY